MKRFRLTLAGFVVAGTTALLGVVPALATNEYYPSEAGCGSCAQTSGPDNYIKNNAAWNLSGEGFCNAAYIRTGEGEYPAQWDRCYSSGNYELLCYTGPEWYGHGQSRRYYAAYNYNLRGRQDNYASCG
jgi:hypothetical protein